MGKFGIHRLRGGHELPARLGKLPGRLGGREKALRRRGRGNARAGREEGRGAVPGEGGGHPPRARADRAGGSGPGGLFRDPGQRLRGSDGGAVYGAGRPVDRQAAALCAQSRQADLFYGRRLRPAGG